MTQKPPATIRLTVTLDGRTIEMTSHVEPDPDSGYIDRVRFAHELGDLASSIVTVVSGAYATAAVEALQRGTGAMPT